jgi:AcrR family transcriptional regulator
MSNVRTNSREPGETRRQLLEAACRVFAEKGFRDATVADICERAGANIAAVNYHFRTKETLYVEAWRLAFQRSLDAHPPDGGVPPTAPAAERLRGKIHSVLSRITDPENREFAIIHQEFANPTGLLAEVLRECIDPLRQSTLRIVRELLGPKASERDAGLCQMSIMSQCMHPGIRRRHQPAGSGPPCPPGPIDPALDTDIAIIAEHITRFSLAGIQEIRRHLEEGEAV